MAVSSSASRDDFSPDSDIDILIEVESQHDSGLFGMARMERKLSILLGRKADLRTAEHLSRHFRAQAMEEAEMQDAQKWWRPLHMKRGQQKLPPPRPLSSPWPNPDAA